ncbi:MAG TPA: hypothetical protein VGL81_11135 [Polyangiaceae bacterium]
MKSAVGVVLAAAALLAYAGEFKLGSSFVHIHEQYHYFLGARYFRELGYANLYRCSIVAEDEIGAIDTVTPNGLARHVDLTAEARDPERTLRNIDGDNRLVRVRDMGVLEDARACKEQFSPERWQAFKTDVLFFRVAAGREAFERMQQDHGFNATPTWILLGHALASIGPASIQHLQRLALVDVTYLVGMFAAIAWAFGWRVAGVAAITWGSQAPANFEWTGGAFLRQDWLFFLVFSMCLARRRRFAAAGASLTYASMLRVFPALIAAGWAVVICAELWRHRRLARAHRSVLLGALVALAVLVPASTMVCGKEAWAGFAHRTLVVHERTWTSNLMGLGVAVVHPFSMRLEDVANGETVAQADPWKADRAAQFQRLRIVAYGLGAAGLLLFAWVARRTKSLWVAGCLAQSLVVFLARVACYYYGFLVLAALLTRERRALEFPLFASLALTQLVALRFDWVDDRYAALSALVTALSFLLLWTFRRSRGRVSAQ